jgi:hypothetical protein
MARWHRPQEVGHVHWRRNRRAHHRDSDPAACLRDYLAAHRFDVTQRTPTRCPRGCGGAHSDKRIGQIRLPETTSNLVFGDPKVNRLMITARSTSTRAGRTSPEIPTRSRSGDRVPRDRDTRPLTIAGLGLCPRFDPTPHRCASRRRVEARGRQSGWFRCGTQLAGGAGDDCCSDEECRARPGAGTCCVNDRGPAVRVPSASASAPIPSSGRRRG